MPFIFSFCACKKMYSALRWSAVLMILLAGSFLPATALIASIAMVNITKCRFIIMVVDYDIITNH